jgi:hypothetical protein
MVPKASDLNHARRLRGKVFNGDDCEGNLFAVRSSKHENVFHMIILAVLQVVQNTLNWGHMCFKKRY